MSPQNIDLKLLISLFQKAREKITDLKKWAGDKEARTDRRVPCSWDDPKAATFGLFGALSWAADQVHPKDRARASDELGAAMKLIQNKILEDGDDRDPQDLGHAEVLTLFDKIIASLSAPSS